MKRFLGDALLIMMLVGLGGYLHQQEEPSKSTLNDKVSDFEDTIAQHEKVTPKTPTVALNSIEENGASRLAKAGSELIVDTMHGTVDVVSGIFDSLIK